MTQQTPSRPPEAGQTSGDAKDSALNSARVSIKSYVLRGARASRGQKRLLEALSPIYCVPFTPEKLDFNKIFQNGNPIICEIGFGTGAASAKIALENPEKNYLGIEVYKRGVGALLRKIKDFQIKNIRIIEHDAADVIEEMFPDQSISGFNIFFPDPWMKRKHRKRRLIKRPFTDLLARKLIAGGILHFVSDWEDYAIQALSELSQTPGLENAYPEFAPQDDSRAKTNFELKALAKNHEIRELLFTKIPSRGLIGERGVTGQRPTTCFP